MDVLFRVCKHGEGREEMGDGESGGEGRGEKGNRWEEGAEG